MAKLVIVTPHSKKAEKPAAVIDGNEPQTHLHPSNAFHPNSLPACVDAAAKAINEGLIQYEKDMRSKSKGRPANSNKTEKAAPKATTQATTGSAPQKDTFASKAAAAATIPQSAPTPTGAKSSSSSQPIPSPSQKSQSQTIPSPGQGRSQGQGSLPSPSNQRNSAGFSSLNSRNDRRQVPPPSDKARFFPVQKQKIAPPVISFFQKFHDRFWLF